jgi:hypothetical protein
MLTEEARGYLKLEQTRRNHLNRMWAIEAMQAMKGDASLKQWFLAPNKGRKEPKLRKLVILSELGRLGDDALIVELARQARDSGMPTKTIVQQIRNYRLGRTPEIEPEALSNRLIGVINEYLATHRATREQVLEALDWVRASCEEG